MMTRDVARSRRANTNTMPSFAMGVKEETRAYAFAAHVATVMFASRRRDTSAAARWNVRRTVRRGPGGCVRLWERR